MVVVHTHHIRLLRYLSMGLSLPERCRRAPSTTSSALFIISVLWRQARAPDSATACLRERVKHRFDVERPNRLLAADFTYVSVGCSPGCEQNDDGFVLGMLEQAVCDP